VQSTGHRDAPGGVREERRGSLDGEDAFADFERLEKPRIEQLSRHEEERP